jgi:hypothetical protein
MKQSSVFFLILGILVIVAALAWIIGGGPPGSAAGPVRLTPKTPAGVPVTVTANPVSLTTTGVPATAEPATAVQATAAAAATFATADDIRDHFIAVAYDATSRVERLNYNESSPRVVICTVSAGDEDTALLERTAREFNNASPTVKLAGNIKGSMTGDLSITFLSEEGLAVLSLSDIPESGPFSEILTRRELYQGNRLAAKIVRGAIYINADLKDEERRHVLVRSLMYQMGLTGESQVFPDSVFYEGENTNVNLTAADKRVITMLYTKDISNSMTIEDLQRILYLP